MTRIRDTAHSAVTRGQEGVFFPKREISALAEEADRFVSDTFVPESKIERVLPHSISMKDFRHLATHGKQKGRRGTATFFYPQEVVRAMWPKVLETPTRGWKSSFRCTMREGNHDVAGKGGE